VKTVFLFPLLVAARLARLLERISRLWAFASLQARVNTRVPRSTVVLGPAEIHGTGHIELGEELYLYPGLYLETQQTGRIRIGSRVVMSRGVHVASFASIEIGEATMIGEYTSIRDANHVYGGLSVRDAGHKAESIRIGRNVWIGRGVTVLPGVTIGDDAVVGANAVVTRDVAAGSAVAGVPAKPLGLKGAA
jgi:acetyltransferase-like isoleucine patch superfamily enzyme